MLTMPQASFFLMRNVIQDYAWGSTTSMTKLFGIENVEQQPQAELWMGAHPNGCSQVEWNEQLIPLSQLIEQDKVACLSHSTAEHFGELPYLFKVLAAEKALSIQVHPNKQEAEVGFSAEENTGVPLHAKERNYKDANHKPELVYALTPYQAMNGFRPFEQIVAQFQAMQLPSIAPLVTALSTQPTSSQLETFFTSMLSLPEDVKCTAVSELITYATQQADDELMQLVLSLSEQYPNDIGLFAPLMLNVLTLQPGEAMFLSARTPHAYIKGTGLEIMANSDNVLRAGLTPKHMDVGELVRCTRFEATSPDSLKLIPKEHDGSLSYPISVDDFKFTLLLASDDRQVEVVSAEILLPLDEPLMLEDERGEQLRVEKGQSVFIPACTASYTMNCEGRVARAHN
ncbi:mannose-6-phosphate isomerase, class I [Vibrio profundum]|uniref:mannose-6-phosphate isomerase, class I n=1 Tax=Vibrio profundum TaxID=2910247 RepID=UPI003D13084C